MLEWLFVYLFLPNPKQRLEKALEASRQEIAKLQNKIRALEAKPAPIMASSTDSSKPAPAETTADNNVPVAEETTTPPPETETASQSETEPQTAAPEPELATVPEAETTVGTDTNQEPDDLTKLGGVGPKLAEAMQTAGITRFAQITEMGVDGVGKRLSENGVRYAKAAAATWAEQAKLAAQGDWKGLKAYQEALKG